MKNFTLLSFLLISLSAFANDIITLSNGASFEGKVVQIHSCDLQFRFDGDTYTIPADDIESVQLESINERITRKINNLLAADDNCWKGTNDGANHGKGGGQFFAGVGFGAFGVIGCAVAQRSPAKSSNMALMSANKDLWNNSEYLNCYNKSARGKAITNSLLGWATWILLLL